MKSLATELKEYDDMLRKHIQRKDCIKISRDVKSDDNKIAAILLKLSRNFLLFHVIVDFTLDGYAIINRETLDGIRYNKFDITLKKILRAENILNENTGIPHNISLKSWKDIFTDLKKHDYHVIIECENLKKPTFEIGPIKRITATHVSIQYYDPTGLLEKKLTAVNYSDITWIKFGDNYTTTFKKYLRKKK